MPSESPNNYVPKVQQATPMPAPEPTFDQMQEWGIAPYSQEAEEATLGGILTNANTYFEVIAYVKPEDFYLLRNKYIFECMYTLVERKEPIDYLTLIQELKAQNWLQDIGGAAYLTQLLNSTPTSAHTTVYAQIVQRMAVRRRLLVYADYVKGKAQNMTLELGAVISDTEKQFLEVTSGILGTNTKPLATTLSAYYERMEKMVNGELKLTGIPTGFKAVDNLFLGFDEQSLTLLGARPGTGKTSFMLSAAINMAKAGYRVALFSMEMGTEQLLNRLVAMEARINTQNLRLGHLNDQEWKRFVKATGDMSKLSIHIDDTPIWTPQLLRAKCTSVKQREGLDIIMLDYVQLLNGGGRYKDNKVAETGFISRSLKGMARELRTPVFGAIQLNRELERRDNKRPILSDLRDLGDWEQDADNVMFLYRDEMYNKETESPNEAEVIVAKHRNGPVGTVNLYFEKSQTLFLNAADRRVDMSRI